MTDAATAAAKAVAAAMPFGTALMRPFADAAALLLLQHQLLVVQEFARESKWAGEGHSIVRLPAHLPARLPAHLLAHPSARLLAHLLALPPAEKAMPPDQAAGPQSKLKSSGVAASVVLAPPLLR